MSLKLSGNKNAKRWASEKKHVLVKQNECKSNVIFSALYLLLQHPFPCMLLPWEATSTVSNQKEKKANMLVVGRNFASMILLTCPWHCLLCSVEPCNKTDVSKPMNVICCKWILVIANFRNPKKCHTVEPHSYGPTSNEIPPITITFSLSL